MRRIAVFVLGLSAFAACDSTPLEEGPPGPTAEEADFVPITPGTVWSYDYAYASAPCLSRVTRRDGDIVVTFLDETVTDGTRRVRAEARARFEERRTVYDDVETTQVGTTLAVAAVESDAGVEITGLEGLSLEIPVIERYHPASEGSIHASIDPLKVWRFRPDTPPELVSSTTGSYGTGYPAVELHLAE